jgi:hypothetical protein
MYGAPVQILVRAELPAKMLYYLLTLAERNSLLLLFGPLTL